MWRNFSYVVGIIVVLFLLGLRLLDSYNGFQVEKHSIPIEEIYAGGPPKDGIPAILEPKFETASQASSSIQDQDRILGIRVNGESKAYPIKILNWHEIVNDQLGGQSIVVTFCPLCGTGMIFETQIKNRQLTFGVSGLLYQSDVLLYDHQTQSLWSQIKSEAVTGRMMGSRLKLLPSTLTTWKAWKKSHPNTLVLSVDTGHRRDYERDPYADYYQSEQIMFEVKNRKNSFHPKEQVIGIEIAGKTKAYPFSKLARAKLPIQDEVGGISFQVTYDHSSRMAEIKNQQGNLLPSVVGFWFAWYAFHPDTEVYTGVFK